MIVLDPTDPAVWSTVRNTLARASRSSLHCALGSTGPDGSPYVTPIGSVSLGEPGHAMYLEVFNVHLAQNLDRDPRCVVLAVDSSRRTWARALLGGRFETPPGVRLLATAGPSRSATEAELERFQRSVRPALHTKGGRTMWGRSDRVRARDLTVTGVVPVRIPAMTQHLWPPAESAASLQPSPHP